MIALKVEMKLFRRKNGYWYVRFERGKEKSLRTKDKRLAHKLFRELQKEALKGRLILLEKREKISLSKFFEEYLEWSEKTKSPETVAKERWIFRYFLDFCGNKPLRSIKIRDIERFLSAMRSKGRKRRKRRKPSGINVIYRHLKAAFNKAFEWGYLRENPLSKVKPVKVPKRPPKFFKPEDIEKLFADIREKEPEFYFYVKFLLETGCRRNEILYLKWEDVDLAAGRIRIRGKGDKVRSIPIHRSLRALLEELGPRKRGRIFSWHPSTVTHKFKKYLRKHGLEEYKLHNLRHTTASWLAMKGVPLKTIQELLGHSTIAVTEIYRLPSG